MVMNTTKNRRQAVTVTDCREHEKWGAMHTLYVGNTYCTLTMAKKTFDVKRKERAMKEEHLLIICPDSVKTEIKYHIYIITNRRGSS